MQGDWTAVVGLEDLPEGRSVRASLDGEDLLLYRMGDRVLAVSNRCTHQGAPLHRGAIHAAGSLVTVSCPVHGSTFELAGGRVLRGPATRSLPVFEARINAGQVEVRPAADAGAPSGSG